MNKVKMLIVFVETAALTAVRLKQIMSFNETGAITAAWTTPLLWIITAIIVATLLFFEKGGEKYPVKDGGILSVKVGVSAFLLGIVLAVNGLIHYQTFPTERFALPTLIASCAASLTLIFTVGAVNVFNRRTVYGKGAMGLPVLFVVWLGFSLIGVFFINKTIRLSHLNAFSILEYSSYLFFFLAYVKEFCGYSDKKSRKNVVNFGILSAVFAVPNVATKLGYVFIPTEDIISNPYNFDFSGILLDFALFAFAVCVVITFLAGREKDS